MVCQREGWWTVQMKWTWAFVGDRDPHKAYFLSTLCRRLQLLWTFFARNASLLSQREVLALTYRISVDLCVVGIFENVYTTWKCWNEHPLYLNHTNLRVQHCHVRAMCTNNIGKSNLDPCILVNKKSIIKIWKWVLCFHEIFIDKNLRLPLPPQV